MFVRAGPTGYFALFALSAVFVSVYSEELTTSQTELSTPQNSTDSTAQESIIKHRKVRNNVVRYGAVYRGNSSVRATRAFTRRPRISRKDRHRHSTKVDTTKIPVVLLPPILTFKNVENDEEHEPFVINVVSPKQPTVLPDLSTKPFTPAYDSQSTLQSTSQYSSKKPFMDEKIMAMKNFGVRMQGRSRGEVKFRGSPVDQSSTPVHGPVYQSSTPNDYTPPPTVYPTEQKNRQVSRGSRRRSKVRTTTAVPTDTTTAQILPRENRYDVPSQSQQTPENSGLEGSQKLNFENLILQESSTPTPVNDFTNASLNDVLNYDIQRTSPRTIFSLDATGPIKNYGNSADLKDSQVESNNQIRTDGKLAVSSSSPLNHPSVTISSPGTSEVGGITVSSPGTPTTHLDDFFSNVPQVTSSFVPRTEVNVATSTSQFFDSSTAAPNEDYDFKDVIYPPLDILAPPYLEDEFHDALGNVLPNVTNVQPTNDVAPQVELTTAYPDLSKNSYVEFVDNGISSQDHFNNSENKPTEPYQESPVNDQSRSAANHQVDVPLARQAVSNQYSDCENGDCQKNETIQPWSRVPVSPSDIKVLSNEDGIELINRMYENLLRVLNGGPDYYDLSEDPQYIPQYQQQQQLQQLEELHQIQQRLEQMQQLQQQQQQQQQEQQQHQIQHQEDRKQDTSQDSSSESNLVLAESGDIRNSRGRAQNEIVLSGRRSSRRKDVQETAENLQLKKARADRKASQLCNTKTLTYVADVSTGCKVFYVCTEFGVGEPMLCPNGTLFNQDYLVCDWWYNVDCS